MNEQLRDLKDRLRATNVEILEKETRVNGTTGSIC